MKGVRRKTLRAGAGADGWPQDPEVRRAWRAFLQARARLITALRAAGLSHQEIATSINLDPASIMRIDEREGVAPILAREAVKR